jgi:uncharacterized YccA/Bax inhibitor family protein
MVRSANPALRSDTFDNPDLYATTNVGERRMTLQGTVHRTFVLLALVVTTASYTWYVAASAGPGAALPWMGLGAIGGLVMAIATVVKKTWSPYTAPVYALLEGLFLGGISALLELRFPGVVIQAVGLTFGTLFCLLGAYSSRLIQATENFKLGVVAATGGIALIYLVTFGLGLFGVSVPYLHESGWIGIGFSLFVVVIAALNLVLDFDFIEAGAARGAPKYMEWFGAFGLVVTLVWLYIEFLRLLTKLRSR